MVILKVAKQVVIGFPLQMGMSLEDVKQWLRHSDIETTSNIYLHYTRTRKKITAVQVNDLFAV